VSRAGSRTAFAASNAASAPARIGLVPSFQSADSLMMIWSSTSATGDALSGTASFATPDGPTM